MILIAALSLPLWYLSLVRKAAAIQAERTAFLDRQIADREISFRQPKQVRVGVQR
jgi:hypothetical protein